MARPSDREYKLQYQIKELKAQIERLEVENARLKKTIDKAATKEEYKKPGKIITKACPDCGAQLNITDMAHAVMELCTAGCGFRNVRNKK
jgi:cell shape-determining protein MreC